MRQKISEFIKYLDEQKTIHGDIEMDLEKDIFELDIGLLVRESIIEAFVMEELDEFVAEYLEQLTQEQIESIQVYEPMIEKDTNVSC